MTATGVTLVPSPAVAIALLFGGAIPLYLWAFAVSSTLRHRVGRRMLATAIAAVLSWLVAIAALWDATKPDVWNATEVITGGLIVGCAILAYVIIWGLLTRGYTLCILTTILDAGRPLTTDEIALAYGQGRGLAFLLEKRLAGLVKLGLVRRQQDRIAVTAVRGVVVLQVYRLLARFLGLRATG